MELNVKDALRRMDRRTKKKETAEDLASKKSLQDDINGEWAWCLHCERAYNKKDMRWDERQALYFCAYEGCSGDACFDAWSYDDLRESHPNWEVIPEMGKTYALYD